MSLGDTAVMVIVIIIAAGVMLVVPMFLMADKVDDAAILEIQEAVNDLGSAITIKSQVTQEDLNTFSERVGATGVAVDYDMTIKLLDDHLKKKYVSDDDAATGDPVYIDITRTQVENELKEKPTYTIPANSPVHIDARIVSNNWVETLTRRTASSTVVASYTGITK